MLNTSSWTSKPWDPSKCPVDLTGADCSPDEKEGLTHLLLKHKDLFVQDGDKLGYTETYKHKIPTTDDTFQKNSTDAVPSGQGPHAETTGGGYHTRKPQSLCITDHHSQKEGGVPEAVR